MIKSATLVYEDVSDYYNVGDYVQSIAAQGFLKPPYIFVNREYAAQYVGEKAKLIMNGWFTHTKTNTWIPSENLDTLLVAFHLNSKAVNTILSKEGIEYLKSKQPIGCRDENTVKLLKSAGIDAYFTGCLTLTLDRFKKENVKREGIYIVDPLYNYPQTQYMFRSLKTSLKGILSGKVFKLGKLDNHLKKIISDDILNKAIYEYQLLPGKGVSEEERFKVANTLLEKYSTAELVITSRIHCALPCLAMGTPVIYINGFDDIIDTCRFEGILELFNRIDVDVKTGEFTSNFDLKGDKINLKTEVINKDNYKELAERMKKTCFNFSQA